MPPRPLLLLAGDVVDIVLPLDCEGPVSARPMMRALARGAPPGDAPPPALAPSAFAHAPQLACLVRLELTGAGRLDLDAMRAHFDGCTLPRALVDGLALALREACIHHDGRIGGWTGFDGPHAGALVRDGALATLPDGLAQAFAEALAPRVLGALRPAHNPRGEPRDRVLRREGAGRRVLMMHADRLAMDLHPRSGEAWLGRIASGAASPAAIEEPATVALGPGPPDIETPEGAHRFTVDMSAGPVVVDTTVLASLLHAPAFRALLGQWREGVEGALEALAQMWCVLTLGGVERALPVAPGGHRGHRPPLADTPPLPRRCARGPARPGAPMHRLELPARLCDPGAAPLSRGVFVHCDLSGTDPDCDRVLTLAMLPFTHTADGRVVEVLRTEALHGESIDAEAAGALVARSDLVVAHDARFVRSFLERLAPPARTARWACSRCEVPWRAHALVSCTLSDLACAYGVFAPAPGDALAPCETGLWLLAQALPGSAQRALDALIARASAHTLRLWALDPPCEAHARLRARGYRRSDTHWSDIPRPWWIDIAPEHHELEHEWLREAVYRPFRRACFGDGIAPIPGPLPMRRITARCRWRADPTDCA